MRQFVPVFLLIFAGMATAARADTYQFTFQGDFVPTISDPLGAGPTLSLSWALTGAPDAEDEFGYPYYSGVPLSSNSKTLARGAGVQIQESLDPAFPITYVSFLGSGSGYGPPDFADLETEGSLFYSGSQFDPVFLTGVYAADFSYQSYSIYDGTLTIADLSTVTPEPSTFSLLSTGLAGMGLAIRRKLR